MYGELKDYETDITIRHATAEERRLSDASAANGRDGEFPIDIRHDSTVPQDWHCEDYRMVYVQP